MSSVAAFRIFSVMAWGGSKTPMVECLSWDDLDILLAGLVRENTFAPSAGMVRGRWGVTVYVLGKGEVLLAVHVVVASRQEAGQLEMLALVLANGDVGGTVVSWA